jgi:hypothetical protein
VARRSRLALGNRTSLGPRAPSVRALPLLVASFSVLLAPKRVFGSLPPGDLTRVRVHKDGMGLGGVTEKVATSAHKAIKLSKTELLHDDAAVRTFRAADVVCFDVDSTLLTCEGIDELAEMAGVKDEVQKLTSGACPCSFVCLVSMRVHACGGVWGVCSSFNPSPEACNVLP